jgi:hypothetical protein
MRYQIWFLLLVSAFFCACEGGVLSFPETQSTQVPDAAQSMSSKPTTSSLTPTSNVIEIGSRYEWMPLEDDIGHAFTIALVDVIDSGDPKFNTPDGERVSNASEQWPAENPENYIFSPFALNAQTIYRGKRTDGYVVSVRGGELDGIRDVTPQVFSVGMSGIVLLNVHDDDPAEMREQISDIPWIQQAELFSSTLGGDYRVSELMEFYRFTSDGLAYPMSGASPIQQSVLMDALAGPVATWTAFAPTAEAMWTRGVPTPTP